MRALLFGALWIDLTSSLLLVGGFFMLLLAGTPRCPSARRWDQTVVAWARVLVLVALGAGVVWLLARTAAFENRLHAALEAGAVGRVLLDTWPGLVWLMRHGAVLVLGAFLLVRDDVAIRGNWIAARGEALVLAAVSVALMSASSHAAATVPRTLAAVLVDAVHLVATGVWVGALVALVLLLRATRGEDDADGLAHVVRAARRFSRAALVAMLLLIASGAMNALVEVESIAGLAGTRHGHLLLLKLTLLVPILVLAVINRTRILPALPAPDARRRLAAFVTLETGLALGVLGLAAAMTLTIPARHAEPVWPLPFRLSLDVLIDVSTPSWRPLLGSQLAVLGLATLVGSVLLRRRRAPVLAGALALVAVGTGVGLPPLVVDAYPTTYKRPPVTYHATSIAGGMRTYRQHCATCHGPTGAGEAIGAQRPADLRALTTSRRHAGELFWIVGHGMTARGMPAFADRLSEGERWDVVNFLRALGAAADATTIGHQVQSERAWLIAPDFTVQVGPLAPGALRDHRGRRMVLLVLYTLPGSRARMAELARSYDVLSILGVEVIAVPRHASPDPIAELGASPPVLFPVVTEQTADIVATYGMFASGAHAELLIDRQGYIRAIWNDGTGGIQAQAEKLNEEKSPPPFPDDHVH